MREFIDDVRATEKKVADTVSTIDELAAQLSRQREQIDSRFKALSEKLQTSQFDSDKVGEFWKQPYAIVPRKQDEWYVIAPTFVDFQIGWLEKTVRGWNYFIVNKFVNWLAQVPKELQEKFQFRQPLPLKVFDQTLLTGKAHQDEAWNRYKKHLRQRQGSDRIAVKQGHEFQLIADMINDGILPFMPQPLQDEDFRDPFYGDRPAGPNLFNLELRSYQKEAWERFKEYGAIGVYWAFGAGKTIIGIWALAHVQGAKLVVVPTTTLREQWEDRIRQYIPQFADEIEVATYHSYPKLRNSEYVLAIFDEAHRLPANTFSRMATIKAKYRLGLSATPYREDGRTDFIFALTGFPVGMDWKDLLDTGVIGRPTVTLYVVKDYAEKLRKIEELLQDDKKTLIYSYWLDLGERISKRFNIPFVYGDTKNRLEVMKNAEVCVVSSVGGEGVSLPDLERVIEAGFQYGSRREEAQLMGRLFHSAEQEPEHVILMTDEELERYEKRLYGIYEKGFRINIVR